jgi:adenosylcobinamide-phosphate synthase
MLLPIVMAFDPIIVAFALAVEGIAGYPAPLYRLVRHPVTWMGGAIALCERVLNRPKFSFGRRRLLGVLALAVLLVVTAGAALLIQAVASWLPHLAGTALLVLSASTLIAQRSLHQHVAAVAHALEAGGVDDGRNAVAKIVGRDTRELDAPGISRAAIESLAENYADGVVAPVLWLGIGGLVGGALYKAINTADSMIGHRNERYAAYGWATARLDDLVNLPASRLAAVVIACAAVLTPQARAGSAISAVLRDARHHRSPNAGWPEAAMAGALGLRIAGPRSYDGLPTNDAWMGNGRAEATADDIRRALKLYRRACVIQFAVVAILAALVIAQV